MLDPSAAIDNNNLIGSPHTYTGNNLGLVSQGLDSFLDTLQSAVNSQVWGDMLPLIDDQLKNSDSAQFIDTIENTIITPLQALGDLLTPQSIQEVLFNTLGNNGLGVLQDTNGSGTVDSQDIQVVETADDINFGLKLGSPSNSFSTSLASDLGLSNLGLTLNGDVNVNLGYSYELGFGVDTTNGFYIDITTSNELDISLDASTPGLDALGKLGILQVEAKDQGTKFDGVFSVNLKDSNDSDTKLTLLEIQNLGNNYQNLIEANLNGSANIKLNLTTSFDASAKLPSLSSDFNLGWSFNNASIDPSQSQNFGSTPTVAFNNVKLNVGTFIDNFVSPIIEEIQQVTEPIQPVVDILTKPLPVISDLTGENVTLLDIAKIVDQGADLSFIDALAGLSNLANQFPTNTSNLFINLGSFNLGNNDIRASGFDLKTINPSITNTAAGIDQQLQADGSSSALSAKNFINQLQSDSSSTGGLEFPILTDSSVAFKLLLGQSADLFSYSMPTLKFNGRYEQFLPILGPLGVSIIGNVGAQINLKFGYDTNGLQQFAKGADGTIGTSDDFSSTAEIFNGFFVSNKPSDPPQLTLYAGLDAGPGVNLVVASASITGGILANFNFKLHDDSPEDGKVRANDLTNSIQKNPLGLFDTSGALIAGLSAHATILGISYDQQIANTTLLNYGGGPEFNAFSQQGTSLGDAISKGLIAVGDAIAAGFGITKDALNWTAEELQEAAQWSIDTWNALERRGAKAWDVLEQGGGAIVDALKLGGSRVLDAIVDKFTDGTNLIIENGLIKLINPISEFVYEFDIQDSTRFVEKTFKNGLETVRQTFENGWLSLKQEWLDGGKYIEDYFNQGTNYLRKTFEDGWETLRQTFENGWETLRQQWLDGNKYIEDYFSQGTGYLRKTFENGWETLRQQWLDGNKYIEDYFNQGTGYLRKTFENGWETLRQTFENGWETLRQQWLDGNKYIEDYFSQGTNYLRKTFEDGWEVLRQEWNSAGDYIETAWDAAGNFLGRNIFDPLGNLVSGVESTVNSWIDTVKSWF